MVGSDNLVQILEHDDVPDIVEVLQESFFDYPVMRFVIGPTNDYEPCLRTLVHFFVMARVFRDEVMLGVRGPSGLEAAALVSGPASVESSPEFSALRERVWGELGMSARSRYEAFGAASASFGVSAPHIHLNMVGVRRQAQGAGLGRRLIEYVHRLSSDDPRSEGVTLTTETESNVALYQRFAYELVGRVTVAPELTTWGFYRPVP